MAVQSTFSQRGSIAAAFSNTWGASTTSAVVDTNLSPERTNAWQVQGFELFASSSANSAAFWAARDDGDIQEVFLSRVVLTARPELDDPNLIVAYRMVASVTAAATGSMAVRVEEPASLPVVSDSPYIVMPSTYIYTYGSGVGTLACRYRIRWTPVKLSETDYLRLVAGS